MTTHLSIPALRGFEQADFDVFHTEGLEARMTGIQERIRPKFQTIGEQLASGLTAVSGNEMFLHIAKHARRTVNPPKDTWLALCGNKRGYKAHPHFQLGLFDDHLFIWLALIYELPGKKSIAKAFLDELDHVIATVPGSYMLSQDHMKKEALPVSDMSRADWEKTLVRFRDVQKAELLIGRHLLPADETLRNGDKLLACAMETYERLMPLYHLASRNA